MFLFMPTLFFFFGAGDGPQNSIEPKHIHRVITVQFHGIFFSFRDLSYFFLFLEQELHILRVF